MFTLGQYLFSLDDPRGLTRTLGELDVCRDGQGRPLYTSGNSAVIFRIRHEGRIRALRCFLRPMSHLREIYGDRLLERELYLYTDSGKGVWTDVVLSDWIEGVSLRQAVEEAVRTRDTERLRFLSESFDRLAADLVADDRAHGDLKPENIIVATDGTLRMIDFDAMFLPAFAGSRSPELGTASYQHPARTARDFDASLDDYPAALISTALQALRLDPTLLDRYGDRDGLIFDPPHIARDPALHEVLELFERAGLALPYRIARLLLAPLPALPELAGLLRWQVTPARAPETCPELLFRMGRCGFCTPERTVIPFVYDNGFDFTEGLAAVRIGRTWHYIDTAGRPVIHCPGCEAVKPFRNGRAVVVRKGVRSEIDRSGAPTDPVLKNF